MQTDKQASSSSREGANFSLFQVSTIVYLLMAGIGSLGMQYVHGNFHLSFAIPMQSIALAKLVAIGGLGAGVLLTLSYLFEGWFPAYRSLKKMIAKVLGRTSVPMAFYLALISAFGEEMLFRGAIQPFAGLALTSILFGLLHLGPNGSISAWSLWAMLAGLLLGWMYNETQSLWPPIIAHFAVNFCGIITLRRWFAKTQLHATPPARSTTNVEDDPS